MAKIDFKNIDLGLDAVDSSKNTNEFILKRVNIGFLDENPENQNIYEDDPEADAFLKDDIIQNGILTPIVIVTSEVHAGRYTIVSGHRRTRIAKELGMSEIEARELIARTPEERALAKIILITANSTQRERKPTEKAKEIEYLKTLLAGSDVANIAKWLGRTVRMSERSVYRYEKFAKLPENVQMAVDRGEISVKQAIGESPVKPAENRPKRNKKTVDVNIASEKIYNLAIHIQDELKLDQGLILGSDATEYLKNSIKEIKAIIKEA